MSTAPRKGFISVVAAPSFVVPLETGSTGQRSRPVAAPSINEATSCEATPNSAERPKPVFWTTICSICMQTEKKTNTATSLRTVTPRVTLAAVSSEQPSSAITAMADAGLRAVISTAASIVTAMRAVTVGCAVSAGTSSPELEVSATMPVKHKASVAQEMRKTCNNIGNSLLRSSGKYISAPAAPAMKERQMRLMGPLMRSICSFESTSVQKGPRMMPITR
mmetsp:Transcript_49842/g.115745  ORF Transcript_49842/g.115745 Transcript_49842/m.115745 type:complete len:221 (-) Transcript_49842:336-998(-)